MRPWNLKALAFLAAFTILSTPPLGAQERGTSPAIAELRARVSSEGGAALQDFWAGVAEGGAPLVEPAEDGRLLVTFLWRGGADLGPIAVFGSATGWTQPDHLLELLPGTDVWYGTFLVSTDARFTYRVSLEDNLVTYYRDPDWRTRSAAFRPDPLNPDTVSLGGSTVASLFDGPEAIVSHLLEPGADIAQGRMVRMTIPSDALGGERSILVYVPAGEQSVPTDGLPLLIMLDGRSYTSTVPTPVILDNLIAQGRIPPVVAAFVEQVDRSRELSANADFTRFLADDLVPALRDRFGAGFDRETTTIAGSSLGGLSAAYAALTRSDVFGAVLAQSGAFWWAPEESPEPGWLMRAYAASRRLPLRFYLEVGRLETEPVQGGPTMLTLTRHMREVLCAKGYPVWYRETGGDHAYVSWRHSLEGGLEAILLSSGHPATNDVLRACEGVLPWLGKP